MNLHEFAWIYMDFSVLSLPNFRFLSDTVGSFCLSEPNSGSDAFALKSKAVCGQETNTETGHTPIWLSL